jgi:hypothetical protein
LRSDACLEMRMFTGSDHSCLSVCSRRCSADIGIATTTRSSDRSLAAATRSTMAPAWRLRSSNRPTTSRRTGSLPSSSRSASSASSPQPTTATRCRKAPATAFVLAQRKTAVRVKVKCTTHSPIQPDSHHGSRANRPTWVDTKTTDASPPVVASASKTARRGLSRTSRPYRPIQLIINTLPSATSRTRMPTSEAVWAGIHEPRKTMKVMMNSTVKSAHLSSRCTPCGSTYPVRGATVTLLIQHLPPRAAVDAPARPRNLTDTR